MIGRSFSADPGQVRESESAARQEGGCAGRGRGNHSPRADRGRSQTVRECQRSLAWNPPGPKKDAGSWPGSPLARGASVLQVL